MFFSGTFIETAVSVVGETSHIRTFVSSVTANANSQTKGRVMVDCKVFRERVLHYNHSLNPHSVHGLRAKPRGFGSDDTNTRGAEGFDTVSDDDLSLCSPTVYGFTFSLNKFGKMAINGLSYIKWDTETYAKLVLPNETKELLTIAVKGCHSIRLLHPSHVTDIISTRGRGNNIILHGEPGTGKTATVEALSEELRLPIFRIKISDLGVEAKQIELTLATYFEVAKIWDCVVLLDEADIFLESRSHRDIHSNAVSAVFLRLLETHDSPLFLTTNRLDSFDPGVKSRAHLVIDYGKLDFTRRRILWKTFLKAGKVEYTDEDLKKFSSEALNGRKVPFY